MKNYIRLLPLMIFPYAYVLLIIAMSNIPNFPNAVAYEIIFGSVIVYLVLTLVCTVFGSIYAAKSRISPRTAAKLNLIVKAVQIPAYIFHFLMFLAGTLMSVWGIGVMIFAAAIDLFTIALTGIHAIGCVVKTCKGGVVEKAAAVFMGIGSFIYCIDVVIAIVLMVMSNKYKDDYVKIKNGENNAVQTDKSI